MTYLCCSIKDGSVTGLRTDESFNCGNLSEDMRKLFFHVHVDATVKELIPLCSPVVMDVNGEDVIVHKFKTKVDIDTLVPEAERVKLRDKKEDCIKPIKETVKLKDLTTRKVTDEPTGVQDPAATKAKISKVIR